MIKVVIMDKKIIALMAMAFWCFGCVNVTPQRTGEFIQTPSPSLAPNAPKAVGASDLIFDPVAVDTSALPDLRDLPFPASLKKQVKVRKYTGIIKNTTKYEVSVPSANSDATLSIPAHSWIEYTAWNRKFDVTVYRGGKPFYCLKINAQPKNYQFMCSKYDFMAEIVKPEPVQRYKPVRKRRIKRKRPKVDKGVQGLG
jgi:hypothetical protein